MSKINNNLDNNKSGYYSYNNSNGNPQPHSISINKDNMQIDNNNINNSNSNNNNNISPNPNNNKPPQYRIVQNSQEYDPPITIHPVYYQNVYHHHQQHPLPPPPNNISPPTTPTSDDGHPPFPIAYNSQTSGHPYYNQQQPHSPLPPIYNSYKSPISSPTSIQTPQQPFSHVIHTPYSSNQSQSNTNHPPSLMKIKIPTSNIGAPAILISPRDPHHPIPNIHYQQGIPPHSPHHQPHSPHHPPHSPHHLPHSPHPLPSPNINNSSESPPFYNTNQYGVDSGQLTPTSSSNIYTPIYSTYPQPFTTPGSLFSHQQFQSQLINSPRDKDGNEVQVSPSSIPPPNHLFYSTHSYPHLHQIYESKPSNVVNKNPNFPTSASTPGNLNNYPHINYYGNKLQTTKKSNTVVPLLSKLPPTQQNSPLSPKTNQTVTTSHISTSNSNNNNSNNSGNNSNSNNGGVSSTTLSSSSSSILPTKNKNFTMLKYQSLPLLPLTTVNSTNPNNNTSSSNNSNNNSVLGPNLSSNNSFNLNASHDSIDSPLTPMSSPSISSLSINTSNSPLSTPPVTPPLPLLGPGSSPQNSPRNPNSPRVDPIALQHTQLQTLKKNYEFLLTKFLSEIWSSIDNDTYLEASKSFKNFSIPLARIKKIMKLDQSVKMISSDAPILFVKAIEIFILELTARAWVHTELSKRKTLQRSDMIHAIARVETFDFLVDVVSRDEIKPKKVEDASKTSFFCSPEGYQYLQYLQLQNYLQETKKQNSIRIDNNNNTYPYGQHHQHQNRLKLTYYQSNINMNTSNNNNINNNNNTTNNNSNNNNNPMTTINEESLSSNEEDEEEEEDDS